MGRARLLPSRILDSGVVKMMVSRNKRRSLVALLLVTIAAVGIFVWYRRSFCYSPWNLRYAIAHQILSVEGYIRWCEVPLGTPESGVIDRFGDPIIAATADDANLKQYVHLMSDEQEWSRPPDRPGTRVFVYEYTSNHNMIIIYYYFRNGRLRETFISQYF